MELSTMPIANFTNYFILFFCWIQVLMQQKCY